LIREGPLAVELRRTAEQAVELAIAGGEVVAAAIEIEPPGRAGFALGGGPGSGQLAAGAVMDGVDVGDSHVAFEGESIEQVARAAPLQRDPRSFAGQGTDQDAAIAKARQG